MARRVIACATVLALAAIVASPASAGGPSGVKVRIFDTTCYGPCEAGDTEFPLFQGEATVVVRELAADSRVAAIAVDDGRVRERLTPGRYELRVKVAESGRPCWTSDSDKVKVRDGRFKRVRLQVGNACIV